MKRKFRLKHSSDFERVRRLGKSYAHPLVVLYVLAVDAELTQFGIITGKSIGNAVQRNRAKRMLREALRELLPQVKPGWDLIVIARKPILKAKIADISDGLSHLLFRADLLSSHHGNREDA